MNLAMRISPAAWLSALLLAGTLPAGAATLFVAVTGSDATGTGASDRPYRTLTHALDRAAAGDGIEVRGGTYREAGELRIRRPGITLRAHAGERVAIVAPVDDEAGFANCIQIDPDADRTTLAGLDIRGGYYYGVMLQTKWDWGDPTDKMGACNVLIQDCAIHDTGRDGIKITPNCDDVVIRRCEIYRTGVGPGNVAAENAEGIDGVNADRVRVQDCEIHDIFSTGIYLKGGATDGLVERTRVVRCGGAGILLGFDTSPEFFDLAANPGYYENIRGMVRNCLVRDTAWEGIGLYAASDPAVFNNTLVNVCTGGIHAALYFGLSYQDWEPGAGRPATMRPVIRNNLVIQPAGYADEMVEIRHQDDLGGMSALAGAPGMDHNDYFIAGGGVARFTDRRPGSLLDRGLLADWQVHSGSDLHSLAVDPLTVAGDPDARLTAASPCIQGGANADWMAGATDLQGNPRLAGGTVDIGASEYGAGRPRLAVSPAIRCVGTAGGRSTLAVSRKGGGRLVYRASETSAWMRIVRGARGTNRGTVLVACQANPRAGARTGYVTVTAAGAAGSPWRVKIVQGERTRPLLAVAPDLRPVGAARGRTSFTVANKGGGTMRYRARESVPWLRIARGATGINRGTITVACSKNAMTRSRTGTVVVAASGADGGLRRVKIVQAGK